MNAAVKLRAGKNGMLDKKLYLKKPPNNKLVGIVINTL